MAYFLKKFKKIYHWLLPYQCILCGMPSTRTQDLCQACYQDLPIIQHACSRCGKIMTFSSTTPCGACLNNSPSFDAAYTLYQYEYPMTRLIMNLKFHQALINAQLLGKLLAQKIQYDWYRDKKLPQAIFPVPLHSIRLKERGFNQAVEIARPIAHLLNLPIDFSSCIRHQSTTPQAQLPAKQRIHNIKNAFQIIKPISYQYIAVLDDVITTGQTLQAFCTALKKTSIQKIDVWCCARPVSL